MQKPVADNLLRRITPAWGSDRSRGAVSFAACSHNCLVAIQESSVRMSTTTAVATDAPGSASLRSPAVSARTPSGSPSLSHVETIRRPWRARVARSIVHRRLAICERDALILSDGGQQQIFGNPAAAELQAVITVHDPAFYTSIVTGGTIGAAESYLRGEWTTSCLTTVFRVLLRNEDILGRLQSWTSAAMRCLHRVSHVIRDNSRDGSRRNIRQHYDLGNDFFRLFLDRSLMYSSAWFESPDMSLEDASWTKVDRVCRALELNRDDHVVEIGTGWGGFALRAAEQTGCRVTTTTISDEQYRLANERIAAAGLSDRVRVLKRDYRDLEGQYDKLVSIEMIEAVGDRHLPDYFATCERLLKPDGAMLIQAITIPEQRFERYRRSVDFIQKYIFPGGFLPSIGRMQEAVGQSTSLRLLSCEDFGLHYARTLREWNVRFHEQLAAVRALGFDEPFLRMWRYYLHYCEAAFLERATGVVHAVWARPKCRLGSVPAR